jgi:phenylalanyl-tRNA synthetase beta chain
MKIPILWLQDYVKTDKTPAQIAASFTALGLMLDKPLDESGVLDLEHRMDRSDWLSVIGCARDLAAFENLPLVLPKYKLPKYHPAGPKEMIKITVETPAVRRFTTRVIRGVRVGESPAWLKERLEAYGIKSINNLVDVTNFVMVEMGQPMHAQDLARLKAPEITLREARTGESLTTILGTRVPLDQETFVLSSGDIPTVIGGIVGGQGTSITATTTDIILDAGNYDQKVIRKTSRRLKIINETVSRYDKFLDPRTTAPALDRAVALILELAGGTAYINDDYYPTPVTPATITLHLTRLELLSGMKFSLKEIKRILAALEYQIVEETAGALVLEIPSFRTDIEVEDDVIADLLRINDYSQIPTAPLTTAVPADITQPITRFEERLRDLMVAQGVHEHITSSLVKSSGTNGEVRLQNALSADQNALRASHIPALQEVQANYAKHGETAKAVFEIGKVFRVDGDTYHEFTELGVVSTAAYDSLATLLHALGITYSIAPTGAIIVDSEPVGRVQARAYTLRVDQLVGPAKLYQPIISEFVHTRSLDLSLLAPSTVKYFDIATIAATVPSTWLSIEAKGEPTKIGNETNYLLTVTWPLDSDLETEKAALLATLHQKLGITSKS